MLPLSGRRVVVAVGGTADARAVEALVRRDGGRPEPAGPATAPPGAGDLLVVDEWTAETAPHVVSARRAGARVTVLAELILTRTPLPVLAVTGTAGKTTACRIAAAILAQDGPEPVIAPAGRARNAWPDADLAAIDPPPGGVMVAELTSTHLCHMDVWGGPSVAVVTCLWPDHVELHGSVEAYADAKRRILRGRGWAVLNAADHAGRRMLGEPGGRRVAEFSETGPVRRGVWLADGRIRACWDDGPLDAGPSGALPAWAHPSSALAACAAALAAGAPVTALVPGLRAAPPLPHRRTPVGSVGGGAVVDDAMAATPRKARDGLARVPDGSVVLIAGGEGAPGGVAVHDDPAERALLADAAREMGRAARCVVLFGPAAARLAPLLPAGTEVRRAGGLAQAVAAARAALRPGETLVLCPAFPMRQEDREAFAALALGEA